MMLYHLKVQPLPVCRSDLAPTWTVKGVECRVEVQDINHGAEGGCQHRDCDNHLVSPMSVREEGWSGEEEGEEEMK